MNLKLLLPVFFFGASAEAATLTLKLEGLREAKGHVYISVDYLGRIEGLRKDYSAQLAVAVADVRASRGAPESSPGRRIRPALGVPDAQCRYSVGNACISYGASVNAKRSGVQTPVRESRCKRPARRSSRTLPPPKRSTASPGTWRSTASSPPM